MTYNEKINLLQKYTVFQHLDEILRLKSKNSFREPQKKKITINMLPVGCNSEAGGRGCKPHKFSILFRPLRSNKCIKMKGSMSNKLLVVAEHKCVLLDILLLAPT